MRRYRAARSIPVASRYCANRAPYPSTRAGGCVLPRPVFRCSTPWSRIWRRRVAPANARTHTSRPLGWPMWELPFLIKSAGGYGPLLSQERRMRELRAKTLRRTGNGLAAARRDLHDCKAALVGAVGAESKQPIDAGKAGWIGQDFRREPLRPLRSRQRRDKRHGVICQRRGAHRIRTEFGAVAGRETAEACRVRRGIKAALQGGASVYARIVP